MNAVGDFKGLADRLKSKENKLVMEAEKVKIGKGVISCDDNMLIPLSAISFVEIVGQEKSEQDTFELKIQNHGGTCFYITAPDPGFIREIRSALMICIGDGGAVYSGMERTAVAGGDKIYGDKITAAADIHIERARRPEAAVSREKKTGSTSAKTITILDDEWKTLEEYALKRMKDFSEKERNHTICEAMAASATLKSREKCRRILEVSGNDALEMIIAGAPIAVKAIVNKLM